MKYEDRFAEGLAEENTTPYNSNHDFTTLKAWRNARKVKLFFYRDIVPLLPKEEL